MERRAFLTAIAATAATAATLSIGNVAVSRVMKGNATNLEPGADIVVRPDSPLILGGSATLGSVELRGGQIVTGGGVINIARLTKA